jgi:putative protease
MPDIKERKEQHNIPELVMGVRDLASLRACKDHADAVYFSMDRFSLRSRANDLTPRNVADFVEQVHGYGLRGYLAVNSVIYPHDLRELGSVLETAASAEVDAIIAWDPATIMQAAEHDLRIHISTQANVSNQQSAEFYRSMGAGRVVLARELGLEQIKEIRAHTDMELEVFVHGAMCQAISGRCYLSAYLLGKSGNCGECSQPCRWQWSLHSDRGEKVDLKGKYLLNAKDLCMIEHMPELIEAGINAFKVEGRLRGPGYTSTVSKCYRKAMDDCRSGTYTREAAGMLKREMGLQYNRGFSTGCYFGIPGPEGLACDQSMNVSPVQKQAVGIVLNYYPKNSAASLKLTEQGIELGDRIVIEGSTTYIEQEVSSIVRKGENIKAAERGEDIGIKVADVVRKNDRVFRLGSKGKF